MPEQNRYARDWNRYSRDWNDQYAAKHRNLGDEWNDADGAIRKRDDFYFTVLAERFLRPDSTVLEVGPGGGKWSVRIAPRVKKLICLDVAQEMLTRTSQRCKDAGLNNVEFVLGNGEDFRPIGDESIDFFFSFDVFVHIALEDTFPYVQEMNRVLKSNGCGSCHHAVSTPPQAYNRIETMNDWYRAGQHTLGQYYYYSPESLRRMYEHCGLQVLEQFIQDWHCTCMFVKPADSPIPRLERLLAEYLSAAGGDPAVRQRVIEQLQTLPRQLETALAPVLEKAQQAQEINHRAAVVAQIRKIWRGLSSKLSP